MDRRAFEGLAWLCFGAAALCVVFAFLPLHPAVSLLAAAAILIGLGYRTIRFQTETTGRADRHRSRLNELQERFERQRTAIDELADNLDMGFFICDRRGRLQYANRRAMRLFQVDDTRDRDLLSITLSHDFQDLIGGEFPTKKEISFTYPRDWIGIAKAWSGSDERIYLSVYEITDLRRLERIRTDFVANVSHEMRTPMTIIRAMSETLLDDEDPDLKQRYLTKIIAEVDRLSTISQDLLVLSAAESNPVRKQSCDLAAVLRDVVNQLRSKAAAKELELCYAGPDRVTLEANPAQMTQVALNLVDNAINYTPCGSVKVELRDEAEEAIFIVTDTGIGIAPEHSERVFERFYRVDKARSRFTGGTGLGLSIVKHIVEAHGGRIELTSLPNEGSTFTVRLPKDVASS